MLVISWNIKAIVGAGNERLSEIVRLLRQESPDVLLLQEVSLGTLPDRLREGLYRIGLTHFLFSGEGELSGKRYGCVVASKWPLELKPTGWAPGAPWPQLLASAVLTAPSGDVDIFVAHIPNGSGNGWRKIETFEALALGLGGTPARPRILAGDFNEPRRVLADGEIIPFGGVEGSNGDFHWEGERYHVKSGNTFPRARWRDGVLSVLRPGAAHGLRHAWFDRHGYSEVTTHETRSKARFFDHIFASSHFDVINAGYHDDGWRIHGPSDHSAAWARLELK